MKPFRRIDVINHWIRTEFAENICVLLRHLLGFVRQRREHEQIETKMHDIQIGYFRLSQHLHHSFHPTSFDVMILHST